jgi:CheY-like chemotaxis protein
MAEALRLLIVEDDPDTALLVSRTLERAGHSTAWCGTAEEALVILGHSSFDLISVGQVLSPGLTGVEFLHALRDQGNDTPAIMVTACKAEGLASRAHAAGAVDFVTKDPALHYLAELPQRVQEAVARRRQ